MKILLIFLFILFSSPVFSKTLEEEMKDMSSVITAFEKQDENAMKLLKDAVQEENSYAYVLMGTIYEEGKLVHQDVETAISYFQKAADKGNQMGQIYLADMYFAGKGVKQDFNKAREYYTLALNGSNEALKKQAQAQLGRLSTIEMGSLLSKMDKKAAAQGDSFAMLNVGAQCYQQKDYSCAFVWLSLASRGSFFGENEKAEINILIENAKSKMSSEEIAKAQKQIDQVIASLTKSKK